VRLRMVCLTIGEERGVTHLDSIAYENSFVYYEEQLTRYYSIVTAPLMILQESIRGQCVVFFWQRRLLM